MTCCDCNTTILFVNGFQDFARRCYSEQTGIQTFFKLSGALWSSGLTRYHYVETVPRVGGWNLGLSSYFRIVSLREHPEVSTAMPFALVCLGARSTSGPTD